MITETDVLTTLSYLMGERTVPTTAIEGRKDFIKRTLEEIYRAYPWPFAKVTETIAVSNFAATLATTFDPQHKLAVYFLDGDLQTNLDEINPGDQDMYEDSDRKFWVESTGNNDYTIKIKDTDVSSIVAKYQTFAPDINASVGTPFQDRTTIALGARRYIKLGENPDADISQDEALYQKRLNENIASQQLARPLRRNRKIYYANNYRLGEN
jgi:hypothetical protein